jgi:hypothetical protein
VENQAKNTYIAAKNTYMAVRMQATEVIVLMGSRKNARMIKPCSVKRSSLSLRTVL